MVAREALLLRIPPCSQGYPACPETCVTCDTHVSPSPGYDRLEHLRQTYIAVMPKTGDTELKRICCGPYSTASDFVAVMAAPLEALYQTKRGLGRLPAVDAIVM